MSDLNSLFNPSQQKMFDGQRNMEGMRESRNTSEQSMYQRREDRNSSYGEEGPGDRNMSYENTNVPNEQFGRTRNEMNNEKHLSGYKNQSSNTLGTGRDDYSDEYSSGYQGGQQNRNFQTQFYGTNPRPTESRGNHTNFGDMGSNMDMDEYDDQGMSSEPFRHTSFKIQSSFQEGNNYEQPDTKVDKRSQMNPNWNTDNEGGLHRRENPFPGSGAASRNPAMRTDRGQYDFGGKETSSYPESGRLSQTKRYEEEEGYDNERNREEDGQERMRTNKWGGSSRYQGSQQGASSRNNKDMQREEQNNKSFGDRRMERDFGSGLVKNPFDPSNRVGSSKLRQFDQMDEEEQYDIPCMNPPAPDPPAPPPAGGGGGGAEGGTGGPDYAKLLQYLQFYQNQMGSKKN